MASNPTNNNRSSDEDANESGQGDGATMSIGALSKATGIPKETIRTWERRYGFPNPSRNSAGHRAYQIKTVEHLRLISRALSAGHRPANVVGEDIDTLRAMLEQTGALESDDAATGATDDAPPQGEWLEDWIAAAKQLDGEQLEMYFRRSWNELGGLKFLTERARTFLNALGDAWADGRLEVLHEHFTSERLRDFLTSKWRPLSDRASGPKVVCATLPGEHHILGLHMAAVIMAMAGCQPVFLGADTPLADIAGAARQEDCVAVLLSVSVAADSATTQRSLNSLRLALDPGVDMIIGGAGNPAPDGEFTSFSELDPLYSWALELAKDHE
jgi:DNA-binding transcriptional MerR regulator/methylmalonyl-CoA mutase cobalamin-binding subunit